MDSADVEPREVTEEDNSIKGQYDSAMKVRPAYDLPRIKV